MLDETALAAAPETPASVTETPVALPDVSGEADAHQATEAPPVVAEAPAAPVSEEMAGLQSRLEQSEAALKDAREQLALHAAAQPVVATLESVVSAPVHLAEEEFEKVKNKVLEALHIHFGAPTPPTAS